MRSCSILLRVLLVLALVLPGVRTSVAAHEPLRGANAVETGGCHEHAAPARETPPAPTPGDCCHDGNCACACAVAPMLVTLAVVEPMRVIAASTTFAEPAAGHRAPPATHRLRPPIARA
jgi:hypothetical protein